MMVEQRRRTPQGQNRMTHNGHSATRAQQHPGTRPDGALKPVYALLDLLLPSHLMRAFNRIERRKRWAIIISVASIVLLWSMWTLTTTLMRQVRSNSGAFLMDALQAPYNMVDRLTPTVSAAYMTILPIQTDVLLLDVASVETFVPGVTPEVEPVAEDPADVAAAPVAVSPLENDQMGNCLWSASDYEPGENEMTTACLKLPAAYLTSGFYNDNNGAAVHVVAAQFKPELATTQDVMTALKAVADSIGRTGNYVIGVGAVDYFYSSTPDLYSFTWAHNGWVYSIASPDMAQLEKAVKGFAY